MANQYVEYLYRIHAHVHGPDGAIEGRVEFFETEGEALEFLRERCTRSPREIKVTISAWYEVNGLGRVQVFAADSAAGTVEFDHNGTSHCVAWEKFIVCARRLL